MDPHRAPHGIADEILVLADPQEPHDDEPDAPAHELARASTRLLPVDAARVFLVDGRAELVAVAATPDLEQATRLGDLAREGPSRACVEDGKVVACPDLAEDTVRWRDYAQQAWDHGFRALHAVPLVRHSRSIGCLNLLCRRRGPLTDADQVAAEQLAAGATVGIEHRRDLRRLDAVNGQLGRALASRVLVEQAKGCLTERHGITVAEAFGRIRDHARRNRSPLRCVARQVVEDRFDPPVTTPARPRRRARR